ncbi:hypothetical protein DHX103_03735 [Planococcus sp. X10-3]|uniref:hypothetical protein n=1 Tax=Planococcus sp. X10-3 TaxID=3061240 RepID=UPI003BAFBA14
MFNILTEAKEAVVQKNKNLALIGQQYQIIGRLEAKISESKKELEKSEKNLAVSNLKYTNASKELVILESKIRKKTSEINVVDNEIVKKNAIEFRLRADLKLSQNDLDLIVQRIGEQRLILSWLNGEIEKEPEERKEEANMKVLSAFKAISEDGIIKLITVMKKSIIEKEKGF